MAKIRSVNIESGMENMWKTEADEKEKKMKECPKTKKK